MSQQEALRRAAVITVPVAVARAVVASRWAAGVADDSPMTDPLGDYKRAVASKRGYDLRYFSSEQLRGLQEPIDAVLEEMAEDDVKASTLRPVQQFAELLRKHTVMATQDEEAEAAGRHASPLREVTRLARLLGDSIRDTGHSQHPTLLKAIEAGLMQGGKPVISGATVTITYPVPPGKPFRAMLSVDGLARPYGPYKDEKNAARAGKMAARRILGSFHGGEEPTITVQPQEWDGEDWVDVGPLLTDMRAL